jgi:protein phosphatase
MADTMRIHTVTRQGLTRETNEDCYCTRKLDRGTALVAVADGLGGHAAGERAAGIAVGSLDDFDSSSEPIDDHLVKLILAAKQKIMQVSTEDKAFEGMGTTLTAAFINADVAHWAHVGDSRLYLFRKGVLVQITEDQTLVGFLVSLGEITKEEAKAHPLRKMLRSCIGSGGLEVDRGTLELEDNDLLILCTDGLHDKVTEETFELILGATSSLQEKLEALIDSALRAGGKDDITVVGVEV